MRLSKHHHARSASKKLRRASRVEALESRVLLTVFTVTNANDSGAGSLRDALGQSNNTVGVDTIAFNIPSTASKVIHLASGLPDLWDPGILDGTTEPGYAGKPLIQIDGSAAGAGVTGMKMWGGSTIKGLSITGFGGGAIDMFNRGFGGNTVSASWIGLDLSGAAAGNNASGVGVWNTANNVIGGPNVADRNVISSSKGALGVLIQGSSATNNLIENNYIGTDPTGTAARPNATNGIGVQDGPNTRILNNLVSGNANDGIIILNANATGNVVQGNIVGLNASGTGALPNQWYGIEIQSANNTIGGTTAAQRNLFSANGQSGVVLFQGGATGNLIQGNYIGTDITGNVDLGNAFQGIAISGANSNTIKSNLISGNNAEGVGVFPGNSNTLYGNTIGFSAAGTPLTNSTWAITLINGSTGNVVGGTSAGQPNIIYSGHPSGTIFNGGGNTVSTNQIVSSVSTSNPGSFAFSASSYSAAENAGTVTITVTRTANTNVAASVNYATTNGTANSGSDYTTAAGTLNFAAGDTSKTFTISILNDNVIEPDETVSLALSAPTAGATLGTPSTSTLTITNDDVAVPGAFSFSASSYNVNENQGSVTITVVRTANTNVAASVSYATTNGSAIAGSDYTAASGTLNFAAGDTSKTFTIAVINDALIESDETVTLSLSTPTAGAMLGTPNTSTLTIVSDDLPDTTPPTVTSTQFTYDTNPQKLIYTFSEDVSASLSPADMYLVDTTTYQSYTPSAFSYDRQTNTATFSFATFPKGMFKAFLFSDGITDAAGNMLDGDNNGIAGGSNVYSFFYLPGDVNHDGTVDFADLTTIAQDYGTRGMTFAQGDVDHNGTVDFGDLVLVSQNYGTTMALPAPTPATGLAATLSIAAVTPSPTIKPAPSITPKSPKLHLANRPGATFSAKRI
jgi:parallel beta-helix repeat protein